MLQATKLKEKLSGFCRFVYSRALYFLLAKVYFGKNPASVPDNSAVFFPCSENILFCGFAGIVSFKNSKQTGGCVDIALLVWNISRKNKRKHCRQGNWPNITPHCSLISDYRSP